MLARRIRDVLVERWQRLAPGGQLTGALPPQPTQMLWLSSLDGIVYRLFGLRVDAATTAVELVRKTSTATDVVTNTEDAHVVRATTPR
ncbi:hypothetical protein ABZ208_34400 [Streptomyces sp. NPDC006208]|uniref:hypothetical protein n=1 Tax=Streptomyces sp. NPDC006208 TaxID=3156734 RepID=UPI0033BBB0CD